MPRLAVFVILFAALLASGQEAASSKRIVSRKYGFSFERPAGWIAAVGVDSDLPLLANFPWSRLQAQAILPRGGATIHILAEEELTGRHRDYGLDDWAEFDQRRGDQGSVSSRALDMPASSDVSRAIIAAYDETVYSPSEQRQRTVTVYWEFRGKRFATYLSYVIGDPKAKQYDGILMKFVRSIRPV